MTISDSDRDDLPDEARLMALADGELPPGEAAAVARAIAADPDAARRFAIFAETRARLSAAAAAQNDVPDALRARVAETIAAHAAARVPDAAPPDPEGTILRPAFGRGPAPAWALPLAASLALAVGLGAGLMARGPGPGAPPVPGFENAGVQDALGRLATGETAGTAAGALRVIASFRDGADTLCREAELQPKVGDGALGVLCRGDDRGWRPELVLRQPVAADGALSAASGLGTLDAFLADIGAGVPLDAEAEARALAE